jgi:hypothetical protein
MSQGLEKIRALGVKRVHQETHISMKNIEAICDKVFDGMNNVQFGGFISILEREYSVDLSDLRAEFDAFWHEHHADETAEETIAPPKPPEPGKRKAVIGAFVMAIVVIVLFQIVSEGEPPAVPEPTVIVETPVEPVSEPIAAPVELSEPEPEPVAEPVTERLEIFPKSKIWIGMIDLETFKKDQRLTADSIVLDTNRSWLLLFGHGYVDIQHNDERIKYADENRIRFLYEDGMLRELTRKEFKEFNRGQEW